MPFPPDIAQPALPQINLSHTHGVSFQTSFASLYLKRNPPEG